MADNIVDRLSQHAEWLSATRTGEVCADAADEIERLRAEVIAIRAERDGAQTQAAHLARRLVTEARLHGGPP